MFFISFLLPSFSSLISLASNSSSDKAGFKSIKILISFSSLPATIELEVSTSGPLIPKWVKSIITEGIENGTEDDLKKKGCSKRIIGVKTDDGEIIKADKVVIATGGISYKSTGSTGDGLRWAGEEGHRISTLKPALVPLETFEKWPFELTGLSLKNVTLSLFINIHTRKFAYL